MNKLSGLIVGAALAVAAPLAFAASDSLPQVGGAEMTYQSDQRGINAPDNTNEFWHAGTGGWASE